MTNSSYREELRCALEAVERASHLCRQIQADVVGEAVQKRDKSPVTIADFASQAVVGRALQTAFGTTPLIAEEDSTELRSGAHQHLARRVQDAVETSLGEETSAEEVCAWIDHGGARAYTESFWTLDPIDGTKGFLRGGQYAIALALVIEGVPRVSVLGCPNLSGGQLFYAVRGQGCYRRSLGDGSEIPIRVSTTAALEQCRFCESVESGHSDQGQARAIADALGIVRESIRMDSQAKYATLAQGEAEIYLRLPTRAGYVERIWDHAAGTGLLEEAGGRVTDIRGHSLDFRQGPLLTENSGVIASHGPAHDTIVRAVQEHFRPPE